MMVTYFNISRFGIFHAWVSNRRQVLSPQLATGHTIVEDFFGKRLAEELCATGRSANLAIANNVLAQVPDINDFVAGFTILLKPRGVASFEFSHLLNLIAENQFDTIYHDHFSYLSLIAVQRIFAANGLSVFDVEEHQTHGGSLRMFAQRIDAGMRAQIKCRCSVSE
jgi:hypothetical protein